MGSGHTQPRVTKALERAAVPTATPRHPEDSGGGLRTSIKPAGTSWDRLGQKCVQGAVTELSHRFSQ